MIGTNLEYLNTWKSLGGGTFIHYKNLVTYCKWGSWGAMQNLNDTNNPKYQTIVSLSKNTNSNIDIKPQQIIEEIIKLLNSLKESLIR